MSSRLTRDKHQEETCTRKSLPWSYRRAGILWFSLILFATLINLGVLMNEKNPSVLALTRGTMYDDVLISGMGNNSENNGTDQLAVSGSDSAIGSNQSSTNVFIYGDYGNDEIQGGDKSDHLSGGPGSDLIYGNNGGDFIEGGSGIDSLYGGAGNDVLSGGEGADYFDCGPGIDSIDDLNSTEGDFALSNCEILENE